MRWIRFVPLFLIAGRLLVSAVLWSCAPAGNQTSVQTAAMTPEQRIAHGRYLSTIMGCNDCHTPGTLYNAPDTTRRLSGSELGWKGPWGISFPQNLTPDSTGIGSWTEEQIVVAIREGRRPDGSPVMPPMPWATYANMTNDDAYALAAYLKSLPAVKHENVALVPPGQKYKGSYLVFPPPSAWDVPTAEATNSGD